MIIISFTDFSLVIGVGTTSITNIKLIALFATEIYTVYNIRLIKETIWTMLQLKLCANKYILHIDYNCFCTDKICENKHRKVIRFFSDYFNVLEDICRVTNKYIVLTLGNRTVDRVKINLNDITKSFLENNGFRLLEIYERDIPNKRTPKKTSKVKNKPVESMNSEFVSIYRNSRN